MSNRQIKSQKKRLATRTDLVLGVAGRGVVVVHIVPSLHNEQVVHVVVGRGLGGLVRPAHIERAVPGPQLPVVRCQQVLVLAVEHLGHLLARPGRLRLPATRATPHIG